MAGLKPGLYRATVLDTDDSGPVQTMTVMLPSRSAPTSKKEKLATLKQEMILAILGRLYRRHGGIPADTEISTMHRQVAKAWNAECDRRKIARSHPPVVTAWLALCAEPY